jgi:hypothetical protein
MNFFVVSAGRWFELATLVFLDGEGILEMERQNQDFWLGE